MRYSPLVHRLCGPGTQAWDIHVRARERAGRGESIIFLSIGDPDFGTPAPVVAAAKASLDAGRTRYSAFEGEAHLRQAIAGLQQRRGGHPVDPAQVVVTAGGQCALFASALCVLAPGDEVIVPEPVYVTYDAVIGAAGACAVKVASPPERNFHPDPSALRRAVTPRTRALLITSPHNPTGAVLSRAELSQISDICREHDLWLISDEVYGGLAYDLEHVSPAALEGMAERTITISSLSKTHGMTGWRLGWAIGPAALARHLRDLVICMLYGSPPFVQDAAVAAIGLGEASLDRVRDRYRRRRDLLVSRLADVPGLTVHRPEGGMFAMLDVSRTGLTGSAFAERLLEEAGVCVLAGDAFGPSAAGCVRISLSASEDEIDLACRRIARFAEQRMRSAVR